MRKSIEELEEMENKEDAYWAEKSWEAENLSAEDLGIGEEN